MMTLQNLPPEQGEAGCALCSDRPFYKVQGIGHAALLCQNIFYGEMGEKSAKPLRGTCLPKHNAGVFVNGKECIYMSKFWKNIRSAAAAGVILRANCGYPIDRFGTAKLLAPKMRKYIDKEGPWASILDLPVGGSAK